MGGHDGPGGQRVLRPLAFHGGRVGHVSRHDLAIVLIGVKIVLIGAAERPGYLRQAIVVGS
jgi:hypothetical protein